MPAITAQQRADLVLLVNGVFGAAPTSRVLSNLVKLVEEGNSVDQVATMLTNNTNFESIYAPALLTSEFATQFAANLLGAAATTETTARVEALVTTYLNAGDTRTEAVWKVTKLLSETEDADFATAKAQLNNKADVSLAFALDTQYTQLMTLEQLQSVIANVTSDEATVTAAKTAIANGEAVSGVNTGEAFTLTTGVDTVSGTSGNDSLVGTVSVASATENNSTLSALDSIDGGAGNDTLKVLVANTNAVADTQTQLDATSISNIETLEFQSAKQLTVDTSAISGVNDVNITKITTGATDITASADQDVTLSNKGVGATVDVNDGKDVSVTLTDIAAAADVVTVNGAAGAVNVSVSGDAYKVADTNVTLSAVNVTGGTTVSVTQGAGDVSKGDADTSNTTITQGDITIDAGTATTTVTTKQDAAVTAKNAAPTTGGVTETASVEFAKLDSGETLIVGGLTFTASKNMTAAEVAAAFASLANNAANASPTTSLLAGDTQSGGLTSQGTYTGNFTGWTSGVVSGNTVVFTSTTSNSNETDLAFTGTAATKPTVTTTNGKANDADITGGKVGIVAGTVDITNGAVMTTVTVDGYSATGSNINGANTALTELNLANGGAFTVSNAAAELSVKLEKVNGTYTQTAGAATINLNSVGNNTADLAIANTETLNVSGTGTVTATTSTLTGLKTLKVSETAGIDFGSSAAANLTSVDTTATTGKVVVGFDGTKATYAGGAGVDMATVTNAGTAVSKSIDLGAGDDTLTLTGATVVVPTVTLKGGEGTDTLSLDAASAVVLDADTAFASKLDSFERLAITGATGTQSIDVEKLGFADYVTLKGSAGTTTLSNFVNNGTLVVDAAVTTAVVATVKDDATGTTDVLNVELTNENSITVAELEVDKIETVNLTVTDVFTDNGAGKDTNDATHTMDFKSSEATTLNIDGTAGLTLTLDAATTKLATIDASGMTEGALTVAANGSVAMTITGGAGADVLTASSGTNAKADVIVGGAGADTIVAGTNGATLTGGSGNDLFILTASSATTGTKESNTYSTITDFSAGDRLVLETYNTGGTATATVTSFSKLAASLNESTATFQNFADAAILEAGADEAVWFEYKGDAYVIVDSNADGSSFTNGEDLVIKLTGVDLDTASFNSTYGTVEIA